MRLICPHCRLAVTVPDDSVGKLTPCPSCQQPITVPAMTGASIDAAPDPVVPPPAAVPRPAPATPPASPGPATVHPVPPPTPPGPAPGAPWVRLRLPRPVIEWLDVAALVVAFVLTFLVWVAAAPNGNRVYTQNAWQAAGGGFTSELAGETVLQVERDLKEHSRWNPWLMFYLILLIPTAGLAIADRVLSHNPALIPDAIRPLWPHRELLIAGLCAVLLLLLIAPLTFGFGLEAAVTTTAEKTVHPPPAEGQPEPTTKEKAERDVRRDVAIARFGLDRTWWLCLAVVAHVLALAGAGMIRWLDRHPNAPDPRLEVYC